MGIFEYESKFNTGLEKVINCVFLNVLWILFCVPVFTAGASTTAFYYTVNKVVVDGEGYVWKTFWKAFKSNFKQSTVIWLAIAGLEIMFCANFNIMKYRFDIGEIKQKYFIAFAIAMMVVAIWGIFCFAYTSKFSNTIKQIMRNSFLIIFKSLKNALPVIGVWIITGIVVYLIPVAVVVVPGFAMWITSHYMNLIYEICLRETA